MNLLFAKYPTIILLIIIIPICFLFGMMGNGSFEIFLILMLVVTPLVSLLSHMNKVTSRLFKKINYLFIIGSISCSIGIFYYMNKSEIHSELVSVVYNTKNDLPGTVYLNDSLLVSPKTNLVIMIKDSNTYVYDCNINKSNLGYTLEVYQYYKFGLKGDTIRSGDMYLKSVESDSIYKMYYQKINR